MAATDEARVDEAADAVLAATDERDGPGFWDTVYDHGLAWVHFPEGFGGLGVAPGLQRRAVARLREGGGSFGNLSQNVLGIGMGGPVVAAHGSDAQRERWLRPMYTAQEIWCQLFSEPGAGSDVAALATRAVRDGDEWVLNGQKVWTTLAHVARWGMVVTRTDPDVPKHAGMTYFVVDMTAPGVEVRPLRQITGEAEFNEVYFTDARVPDANRIGDVGDGWRMALATLMNERVAIGSATPPRGGGAIATALEAWEEHGGDAAARDRLTALWIEAEALRLTNVRASQMRRMGTPGPEGSTGKLHWADLNKRIYEFAVDLLGPEALIYRDGYELVRPDSPGLSGLAPQKAFLRSRANSIEGGTSEIMRNILGERVLGLPSEPRIDKEIAWKDVPR
ncbi:MAG: acyl-CoA dehydrogenase family protein [Acidimicrobiia bacterium]